MRPIIWGLIVFLGCGALWLMSTGFAVFEQLGNGTGIFTFLFTVTMIGCLASLPVAIVAEVIQWRRRRSGIQ